MVDDLVDHHTALLGRRTRQTPHHQLGEDVGIIHARIVQVCGRHAGAPRVRPLVVRRKDRRVAHQQQVSGARRPGFVGIADVRRDVEGRRFGPDAFQRDHAREQAHSRLQLSQRGHARNEGRRRQDQVIRPVRSQRCGRGGKGRGNRPVERHLEHGRKRVFAHWVGARCWRSARGQFVFKVPGHAARRAQGRAGRIAGDRRVHDIDELAPADAHAVRKPHRRIRNPGVARIRRGALREGGPRVVQRQECGWLLGIHRVGARNLRPRHVVHHQPHLRAVGYADELPVIWKAGLADLAARRHAGQVEPHVRVAVLQDGGGGPAPVGCAHEIGTVTRLGRQHDRRRIRRRYRERLGAPPGPSEAEHPRRPLRRRPAGQQDAPENPRPHEPDETRCSTPHPTPPQHGSNAHARHRANRPAPRTPQPFAPPSNHGTQGPSRLCAHY